MKSVIEELLPFDCLHFNDFFDPLPKVIDGWNFMKLILTIDDHCVVLDMNICQNIPSHRGVIA